MFLDSSNGRSTLHTYLYCTYRYAVVYPTRGPGPGPGTSPRHFFLFSSSRIFMQEKYVHNSRVHAALVDSGAGWLHEACVRC